MADWDANSPELEENLKQVQRRIRQDARDRKLPTIEAARHWQAETMHALDVPDPKNIGAFRGEPGLENVQVHVAGRYGVSADEVAAELAHFEEVLQRAVKRLDELIPLGAEANADQLAAVIRSCAWAHAEWVRIHPFANGNGRTARLWANSLAMRYGLPPFLCLRPRPEGGYGTASRRAMHGDWEPTVTVFYELLEEFLNHPDSDT